MANDIFSKLIDLAASFLSKKAADTAQAAPAAPVAQPAPEAPKGIDWANPACQISRHFKIKEALLLPSWSAYHSPSEEEKEAIQGIADKVEKALDVISQAIGHEAHVDVHAWMRPAVASIPGNKWDGKDYNRYIYETQVWKDLSPEEKAKKSVPNSPHKTGHAIDFHVIGFEGKEGCAKIRAILEPKLEELGLRMEDISGGWVHLDDLPVGNKRFFKP